MKNLFTLSLLFIVSCSSPKQVITIPFDNGFRRFENGVRAQPNLLRVRVCSDQDIPYEQNIIYEAIVFWNRNLNSCRPFKLVRRSSNCDVNVVTAIPSQTPESSNEASFGFVIGATEDVWNTQTGRFIRGNITVDLSRISNREAQIGVLAHELGHLLGLQDDPGRYMAQLGSVMADPMPRIYRATEKDVERLRNALECSQ